MKKESHNAPLSRCDVDAHVGLNLEEVHSRMAQGAVNQSRTKVEKSNARIIADNAFTFFNCILYLIALIFAAFMIYLSASGLGEFRKEHFGFTKFLFLGLVLINAAIGSIQEIRSKYTLRKLRIVTEAKATVIRDGEKSVIPASMVVLDDVLFLSLGDQVPVDLIVLEGEIAVDESLLTGESDLVKKKPGDIVYAGSSVFQGSCYGKADKVGDDTYASILAAKVKSLSAHKSELMVNIYRILNVMAVTLFVIVGTVGATLIYKVARHGSEILPDILVNGELVPQDLTQPTTYARIFVTMAGFAVGVIPTGLVLITSVTLAVSIRKLAKQDTLIQELYSLENLSRVNVICLDKTGTLTDGTMKVVEEKLFVEKTEFDTVLRRILASSESSNLTSKALEGHYGKEEGFVAKEVIPFSSANKYSGYVDDASSRYLLGAPEYLSKGNPEVESFAKEKAELGLRVLLVTKNGTPLGLVALEDGIRASAKDTISFFYDNGVDVRIISGDNPITVSRIALTCGVKNAEKAISLEGVALEKIPELIDDYVIFARVSPEQKQALVEAMQSKGMKVAMTGDGVNDILALRKASASITFASATDAAKSCADVVLLDDDFSHLKEVVGEGRRVVNNIERTAIFFLMKTISVSLLAFALIMFKEGHFVYSLENVYLLEITVIAFGGFLLSMEKTRSPIVGKFSRNVAFKAIPAGILVFIAAFVPIVLYKLGLFGDVSQETAKLCMTSMISLMSTLGGFTVMVIATKPWNKYRVLVLGLVFVLIVIMAMALPRMFLGAKSLSLDKESIEIVLNEFFQPWHSPAACSLLFKDTGDTNWACVGTILVFLAVMLPLYGLLMARISKWLEHKNKEESASR